MAAINTIFIQGHLTREPELRFVASGTPLLTFAIAHNRNFQRGGEWVKETSFVDVKAWGPLAERSAEALSKGAEVIVAGRIEQERWEKDGVKQSRIAIVADRVDVVSKAKAAPTSSAAANAPIADDDIPF